MRKYCSPGTDLLMENVKTSSTSLCGDLNSSKTKQNKKTPILKKNPQPTMCKCKTTNFRQVWTEKKINPGNRNADQAEDTTLKTKQKQIHKDIGNPLLVRNFTESKYCQPPKQLKS